LAEVDKLEFTNEQNRALGSNITFELKPHYTQMHPKSIRLEATYLLLREFEEVCSIMHFPSISIAVVGMKLIHIALKDSSER